MSAMKKVDLEQGSDPWKEFRLDHLCASEAPIMIGKSKHMTRNQLLDLKKGWKKNPESSFKQKLFQKGHESEEAARGIVELRFCEDFPAIVATREVAGMVLAASFDGLQGGEEYGLPWEHKEWNEQLAENVRNCVLEPHYYFQLEHQALVAGTNSVLFTCSDGTEEKCVNMTYESVKERRAALIAGWKQFVVDLDEHEIAAKQEVIVAGEVESLPSIRYEVNGSLIVSNIGDCLPVIKDRAQVEMNRVLETEQDFVDKAAFNKATKAAREKLKVIVSEVRQNFESFSDFSSVADEIDKVLQKMQSSGEKQVKDQRQSIKKKIVDSVLEKYRAFFSDCNKDIEPYKVGPEWYVAADFAGVMKNKRSVDGWQSAVDDELARVKAEVMGVLNNKVFPNIDYLNAKIGIHLPWKHLFIDAGQLLNKDCESFQAIVTLRIAEHEDATRKEKEYKEREAKEAAERRAEQERLAAEEKEINAGLEAAAALDSEKAIVVEQEKAKEFSKVEVEIPSQVSVSEIVKDEMIVDENVNAYTARTPEQQDFIVALSDWCDKYDLGLLARHELEDLLVKHSLIS